jgi:hypothetical protein
MSSVPLQHPNRRLLIDWTGAFSIATAAVCANAAISFGPSVSRMLS